MLKRVWAGVALVSVGVAAACGLWTARVDVRESAKVSAAIHESAARDEVLKSIHTEKVREVEARARELAYQQTIVPDIQPYSVTKTAVVVRKVATTKPVVFLTIDDGLVKNPDALAYIKEHRLNPTLFLTDSIIKDNYDYFREYQDAGIKVENHTMTHPNLAKLGLTGQKAELCGMQDKIQSIYGVRPTIMRPPYGEYNATTQQAAFDCGLQFVVHWSAKVDGGAVQYQSGKHLVAGDVVLMHFRPMMMEDLKAFNDEVVSQGLTPAYLSDWLR